MDSDDLLINIIFEMDSIRFISELAKFAIDYNADIDISAYLTLFWDFRKRSERVVEMAEKLHSLKNKSKPCKTP